MIFPFLINELKVNLEGFIQAAHSLLKGKAVNIENDRIPTEVIVSMHMSQKVLAQYDSKLSLSLDDLGLESKGIEDLKFHYNQIIPLLHTHEIKPSISITLRRMLKCMMTCIYVLNGFDIKCHYDFCFYPSDLWDDPEKPEIDIGTAYYTLTEELPDLV